MSWMAWTELTVTFFSVIAVILICMTVYEIKVPCIERKGFLPISTTRGDRLFIGLLTSAYIHLAFLAVTELSLMIALALSVIWLAILLRWG
jgi:predicted small integral membrane protein